MGGKWRKLITQIAADRKNVGQVKKVIVEATAKFKEMNPNGMMCKNGDKFIKPEFDQAMYLARKLKETSSKEVNNGKQVDSTMQEEKKIPEPTDKNSDPATTETTEENKEVIG